MCVVDMHRLYRSEKRKRNRVLCGEVLEEDATVIRFSDLLCGQLLKLDRPTANPNICQQLTGEEGTLERIKIDGETTHPLTHGKSKIGKTVGQTIHQIS
jgi:hypothetical protein